MGSVFTSQVTDTVPIPHDVGQSAIIRQLAPHQLDKAAKVQQTVAIADLRALGGAAFLKEMQELTDKRGPDQIPDPLLQYDRVTLLEEGVLSWTYPESATKEYFKDLNDQTLDVLARAVLKLAKPSLFQTEKELEAATKNAASGSIAG